MALGFDQREAGPLVDAPRRDEHVVGPEHELAIARGPGERDALVDEPLLRGPGNSLEHRADLSPCGRVEPSERLTTTRGEGEHARPPVLRRDGARDQAPTLERAEHPREIAGVQNEIADERARARSLTMRELEQHSRFGQRKAAVQIAVLERADAPRVEAVEAAYRGDALGARVHAREDS